MTTTPEKRPRPTYDSESYASKFRPDKSIYQDDSRMFHRAGIVYNDVKTVRDVTFDAGTLRAAVSLASGANATVSLTPLAGGMLRLKLWKDSASFDDTSPMLATTPAKAAKAELSDTPERAVLDCGEYSIVLTKDPFGMQVIDSSGKALLELENERIAGKFVTPPLGFREGPGENEPYLSWRIRNTDRFFGLGEKWNKVEKTSTRATIWASDTCGSNTTDMSYKAVPVLFCTAGWGMMLHSSYRSYWEIGTFSYTSGSVLSEDEKLDAFLFFAPELKGLLRAYTGLTGRPAMPPKWALGVWMSRCAYRNSDEVDEVVLRLREEQIPCDVVHIDPHWMKTHYYFKIGVDACDFEWNEEGFPNHKELFAGYRKQGFSVCLWINPYLPEGTRIYDEAKRKGYMLKTPSGEIARLEHGQPVGMVDFVNPEAKEWWKGYLKGLIADGASVLKPDYGDRVPESAVFHDGRTGKELHNLYLHLFAETAYEAAREVSGQGIVWRRAGYIGTQRYPGTWAGDTQVSWEAMRCCLRGGLSAGLTGEAFWSHDIGGFRGEMPDPELYIRWVQFGLLSPLSRFHGTTPREPWHYGETALAVTRHYAELRYALIPYLLASARQSTATGVPMLRHMRLEFPGEHNIDTIDDQYMLGPDLLVAPVMAPGVRSRPVYFPAGRWTSMDDPARVIEGGRYVEAEAPLERVPLFVRQGAIIPMLRGKPRHLKDGPAREFDIAVYPGEGERTVVFDDEGMVVSISARIGTESARLSVSPAPVDMRFTLYGFKAKGVVPDTVSSRQIIDHGTVVEMSAAEGGEFEARGTLGPSS